MKRKVNIRKIAWAALVLYLIFAFGIGFKEMITTKTYVEQLNYSDCSARVNPAGSQSVSGIT